MGTCNSEEIIKKQSKQNKKSHGRERSKSNRTMD